MFKDNKILILGFARSGYEAAKVLIKRGNEVILNDRLYNPSFFGRLIQYKSFLGPYLSHSPLEASIEQIRNICDRCIWLEDGKIVMEGEAGEVCKAYVESAKK